MHAKKVLSVSKAKKQDCFSVFYKAIKKLKLLVFIELSRCKSSKSLSKALSPAP
jgi:hypothetical protein